jgi:hypothetical protein
VNADGLYGPLADSVRRISQKLHFESAPGLSTLNGSLFSSTEELQDALLAEMQSLERAKEFHDLLMELHTLKASGLHSAFEQSLYALPAKASEIYQEPGISRLFDALPPEVAVLIPASGKELPSALEKSKNNLATLKNAVSMRQKALTVRIVERENHAALISSRKGMTELIKILGGAK